jgi:hypothetical protein
MKKTKAEKAIKALIVIAIMPKVILIALVIVVVLWFIQFNYGTSFCLDYAENFHVIVQENNGIIEYNMLSSVYKENISEEEYYDLDLLDLYARINEISDTIEREFKPWGRTRTDWLVETDNLSHADIARFLIYDDGLYFLHVADVSYDETSSIFFKARVVYWRIHIYDYDISKAQEGQDT